MAKAKFQFSIEKEGGLKRLLNRMSSLVSKKIRNNFGGLRPVIEDAIDEAVEKHSRKLIPALDEIAELGVGTDGSPDPRAQVAWKGLKTGHGATTLTSRKRGSEKDRDIGEINISIHEETFYEMPDSIIETPDSDIISQIPWMKWLVQGKEISGDRFSPNKDSAFSRTGRGIMISGGFWSFQGRGSEIYDAILKDARLSINRALKGGAGVKILRKLR
jgi:hypothetical protein